MTTGKAVGLGLAWLAGILVLIFVIWGISTGFRYWSAPIKGKVEAREAIQSGQSRIAAYDHFFNACASIQGLEASLAAQQAALNTTTDSSERQRIEANIAGITAARGQAIAQYNADARKDYTIGQFRASDLPYTLNPEEATSCVV